jgi:hypothetical protein
MAIANQAMELFELGDDVFGAQQRCVGVQRSRQRVNLSGHMLPAPDSPRKGTTRGAP